jgi:hypothetical protein
MKRASNGKKPEPPALKALRRAAKEAIALARRTGTPAYVLRNGRIIRQAARQNSLSAVTATGNSERTSMPL